MENFTTEQKVIRAICRQPSLALAIPPAQIDLFVNPLTQSIIRAIQHLNRSNIAISPLSIAQYTQIPEHQLVGASLEAETRWIEDISSLITAVMHEGMKERMLNSLADWSDRLGRAEAAQAPQLIEKLQHDLITFGGSLDERSTHIGGILREWIGRVEGGHVRSDMTPCGIPFLDNLYGGGVPLNYLILLAARYKRGKTMILRWILFHLALNGAGVVHIAHDGGNPEAHMLAYWSMLTMMLLEQQQHATTVLVRDPETNHWRAEGAVTPRRLLQLYAGTLSSRDVQMDQVIVDAIATARDMLEQQTIGDHGGWLKIYGSRDIGGDLDRLMTILMTETNQNMRFFAVDHANQIGSGRSSNIYERLGEFTRAIDMFKSQHPVTGIVVQQMNPRSSGGDETPDTIIHTLYGGDLLMHACDSALTIHLPDTKQANILRFTAKSGRWTKSDKHRDIELIFESNVIRSL